MQNNLPKYILTKENTLREDPNGNITFVAQAVEFAKLHAADAKTAWAECEALREKVAALEAALSTDAEPVKPLGYMRKNDNDGNSFWVHRDKNPYYSEPVYACPRQPAPSVAVKAGPDMAHILQNCVDMLKSNGFGAANIVDVAERALSAQVQDESEIIECLLSGKPFVFDPATNFCHADDGGAPDPGIKYVPAAQVQDDEETKVAIALGASVLSKIADPAAREIAIRNALTAASVSAAQVQDVAGLPDDYYSDDPAKLKQLLAQRDKWLVDNDHWHDFTRSLPAAPANQEGGTNE